MKKIIVIGSNSYLSRGLGEFFKDNDLIFLKRPEIIKNKDLIISSDFIINFCIQPEFFIREFSEEEIIDVQIAKIIKKTSAHLFFISSRKVYGSTDKLKIYNEQTTLKFNDFYTNNKILAERALKRELGGNLTILRVGNIIGEPILKSNYNTFIGWITKEFVENGKIIITKNPNTIKDFITKEYFQETLSKLVKEKIVGVFNIGSGLKISLVEIIENIIGKEAVVIDSSESPEDQFLLDTTRLNQIVPKITKEELLNKCAKYKTQLYQLREKFIDNNK